MTREIFSMILDAGFGLSALYLASKLTLRVNQIGKKQEDHETRITVLERKAA